MTFSLVLTTRLPAAFAAKDTTSSATPSAATEKVASSIPISWVK